MADEPKFVGEVPGAEAITVAVPVEMLGPPGLSQTLHVVDVTKDGETPRATGRRPFRMWGALFPAEPPPQGTITMSATGGDTHLDFGCTDFWVEGGRRQRPLKLHFFANPDGRIACVQSTFDAESWTDAHNVFRDAVSHLLSLWSWHHDVPLVLTSIGGRDDASGTSHQVYVRPARIVTSKPGVGTWWAANPTFQAAASYYREGISSPSAPYRLLCFYKVFLTLEHVRRDYVKRGVESGHIAAKDFNQAIEVRVEASDVLAVQAWPDAVGWRIGRVASDKVREVRNRVGHELLKDDDDFCNFDDPRQWDTTRDAADAFVPLLRRYAEKLNEVYQKMIGPAEAKSRPK